MKTKQENIFNKYLDTKQKKITAVILAGVLVIGCASAVALNTSKSNDLILKSDIKNVELGQKVSTNIDDYLDHNKLSGKLAKKIIKNTKEKDNLKYAVITNKDENGKVISKKKKDYPEVGNYKIDFAYESERATVKITVKDTTKPEIIAPENIDVIQYTDLSTFDFKELLEAKDYSSVKEWKIDTSNVDVNTIGTYDLKISIQDSYKNKATKKIKVNIVEAPAVNEGEVAVTEVITDENGNKKTVITKKADSEVTTNDSVASSSPVSNKGTVETNAASSATSSNTSNTEANGSGNTGSPNGGNTNTSKPSSSKTDNSSTGKPSTPAHTHTYSIPITKVVHHDAVTKTVHHDAVVESQPVYETHIVCKVCGKDFGKYGGAEADDHSCDTGHSYHSTSVQTGTKQVTVQNAYNETVVVKEAYDETVTTGYRCSCGAVK